ncbi:MAG: nickel pincer cofactor biosynthesis protein LarB [Bacillota bacterium]
MNKEEIKKLLESVKEEKISLKEATEKLENLPFTDLGFAKIDNHREMRVGYPEIIYCEQKTVKQVREIILFMNEKGENILATRASKDMYNAIKDDIPLAKYNELGRTIVVKNKLLEVSDDFIAIVAAGTSDLPVVEEAKETAQILGNKVETFTDVGVAGIHRLFGSIERIRQAKVVIVVAGMEAALASVVGGMVDKPIIAVPTSVGYGTSFNGVAALLSMLNSCASGVSVVNIDNGFGAAYNASMINKL